MIWLILGVALWSGSHLWKRLAPASRARAGDPGRGIVALGSALGIVLMVLGYRWAEGPVWWGRTPALTGINNLLVLVAFYLAAASVEAGHPQAALHAAAAKAQVCGAASAAADTALVLHGAIGYTWEHDLQIFYKRAKLDAELCGSPAVWNERLAQRLDLLPTAAGGEATWSPRG